MAKYIYSQRVLLAQKAQDGVDKLKARALSDTVIIESYL